MVRNKVHTLINLLGLAIGMAACILILLFVRDELSYDRYHEHSDRIYRMSREWMDESGTSTLHLGHVAPPFGPLVENDFSGQVEKTVRFLSDNPLMTYEEKQVEEDRFFFADASVFEVFSFEMKLGDPATALTEPNTLVLTESCARKYFGEENPIGKTINYDTQVDMKVTGVIEDVPSNSHFVFDMLASFQTVENFFGRENLMHNWGSNNYSTYLLLAQGVSPTQISDAFPAFLDKHIGEWNGKPVSHYNILHLLPLTDIHLHSHLDTEIGRNGDMAYIYIYTLIALLILAIACINFINLSTARSSRRAREVGLRKVIGAVRWTLIRQFISESLLISLFALGIGLMLVHAFLPFFNDFAHKSLELDYTGEAFPLFMLLGITLLVGLVAGSYPAFYLSAFEPVAILRGTLKTSGRKSPLRSVLVVLQFTISIALIISVGIVRDQLAYMKTKPLGFNQENVLVLPLSEEIYNRYPALKTQWLSNPGILDVTISSRVPSGRLLDSQGGKAEVNGEMKTLETRVSDIHVGHDYLNTFGVSFVAGRNFDVQLSSDSSQAFVLNEASIQAIGWPTAEAAIGKKFEYGEREGTIIGVVSDFHFESLHQSIAPIVFMITQGRSNQISMRIHESTRDQTLAYLSEQWGFLNPGFPFDYYFVSERFNEGYAAEDRLGKIIGFFSFLAIFIAALGLFGLASFTVEQRFREIGIRKVMGASVSTILLLLTRRFTLLVVLAFLIAAPLAGWLMSTLWMDSFAYSGGIQLFPFIAAGVFSILVAWLTVGYQSYRAASLNPVDAIRQD